MISIVVPVLNEEGNVAELHRRIKEVMENQVREQYEIVFVDDGSTDRTFEILSTLTPITIVRFRKNYKQTAGLDAGIQQANGEIIITMDGDLQNDPNDIPRLLEKLREGYDVVSGWRSSRKDSVLWRNIPSALANWLTSKITGLKLHDYACALKAYRSDIVKEVRLYGEIHRFLPALCFWRGARVVELPVTHHARLSGISKYKIPVALSLLFDLFTVKFLMKYSTKPIHLFGWFGTFFYFIAVVSGFSAIALKLMHIRNFGQTPLPLLTVLLVILGTILFLTGLLAELLVRVYYATFNQTPYSIKEIIKK